MAIIHTYSDREQKKLNIKIYSSIAVIVGVILLTYTISTIFSKPQQSNIQEEVKEIKKYLCIDSKIDESIKEEIEKFREKENLTLEISSESSECDIKIVRNPQDTNPYILSSYQVYSVVTNFKNTLEEIDITKLTEGLNSQKYDKYTIIWSKETDTFLRSKYDFGVGQTVYSDSEIKKKLASSQEFIAIVPFENISLTSKLLTVDGKNILKDDIGVSTYTLTDSYWYSADQEYKEITKKLAESVLPKNNFEKEKLTSITLTGTSAIGSDMYNVNILAGKNINYMTEQIKSYVPSSEFLHISNEVSIYKNCIQKIQSTYLCSIEKDFSIIKKLGVDIVNVSGNHIMDFGYDTFISTLEWYENNKVPYSGGGKTEELSQNPTIVKYNDLKIAFLGYNFMPPYSYYARGNNGGSTNISFEIMRKGIALAKKKADIVVVDMNWATETQDTIDGSQRDYANKAHEFGADIVNGVSSYSILGSEINSASTTFYGLGGFIHPLAKNGIMVRHIFYDKKYIAIEITPITYGKDHILQIAQEKSREDIMNQLYKTTTINYNK